MKLRVWLNNNNISVVMFADTIGVSRTAVYRYISGERRPDRERMRAITRATKNAVTANDFVDVEIKPRKAPAKPKRR